MLKTFILLFISQFFVFSLHADDWSTEVREKCKKWNSEKCSNSCSDSDRGKFTECYIDPQYAGNLSWRNCYALHIGYSCPPCQDYFATNYGGAFKKISCEYFYNAIEKKNKSCKNCLQIMRHLSAEPDIIWPE